MNAVYLFQGLTVDVLHVCLIDEFIMQCYSGRLKSVPSRHINYRYLISPEKNACLNRCELGQCQILVDTELHQDLVTICNESYGQIAEKYPLV